MEVKKFGSVLKTLALDYLQQYYQIYSQSLFQQTLEVQDWDYLYPKILLKPMAAKYRHKIMTMEKVLCFHLLFQKQLPHRFVILNSISKLNSINDDIDTIIRYTIQHSLSYNKCVF